MLAQSIEATASWQPLFHSPRHRLGFRRGGLFCVLRGLHESELEVRLHENRGCFGSEISSSWLVKAPPAVVQREFSQFRGGIPPTFVRSNSRRSRHWSWCTCGVTQPDRAEDYVEHVAVVMNGPRAVSADVR